MWGLQWSAVNEGFAVECYKRDAIGVAQYNTYMAADRGSVQNRAVGTFYVPF